MEKIPTEENKTPTTLLEWDAPEFIKHPKGQVWFFVAGLFVLGLISYAIITRSWTMAVAFIVLAGVYYLSHHHEPRQIKVKLTKIGVQVGSRKIPYNQIKAFWIIYKPPAVKTLKLLTTDKILGELAIQLDGQAPGEVRTTLMKHVPEYEGKEESFVDLLIRSTRL